MSGLNLGIETTSIRHGHGVGSRLIEMGRNMVGLMEHGCMCLILYAPRIDSWTAR